MIDSIAKRYTESERAICAPLKQTDLLIIDVAGVCKLPQTNKADRSLQLVGGGRANVVGLDFRLFCYSAVTLHFDVIVRKLASEQSEKSRKCDRVQLWELFICTGSVALLFII